MISVSLKLAYSAQQVPGHLRGTTRDLVSKEKEKKTERNGEGGRGEGKREGERKNDLKINCPTPDLPAHALYQNTQLPASVVTSTHTSYKPTFLTFPVTRSLKFQLHISNSTKPTS